MANGDIYVRRNNSLNTVLPDEGAVVDTTWDVVEVEIGNFVDYTGPNFTLDTGMYLIMYSERFDTSSTVNNERIEIQGEIHVPSQSYVGGYSQDFIRKQTGHQGANLMGSAIIQITSNDTDFFVRFYRTDNSTEAASGDTVNRVPGYGSVMIVQLDNADSYGFYTNSSQHSITVTESVLPYNTLIRQNTGFTRVGNTIEVADAGRYFVTYAIDFSTTGTGREDVVSRLMNNGVEITGTSAYCYLRGADGCQDGAVTWMGVLDLPANSVIDLRAVVPTSANVVVPANGATLQFWKLPAGNKTCIMEATDGDFNATGPFTWDTVKHIDSDYFTAVDNSSVITSIDADYCLTFSTLHNDGPDTVQRAYPILQAMVDGVISDTASSGSYHRNSGGSGRIAINIGDISVVDDNNDIQINISRGSTATGQVINDSGQFSVLSLTSVFGAYVFPPTILAAESGTFGLSEPDVDITGVRFGSTQGGSKVYLANSLNFATASKVEQVVNSWSDTLINIDIDLGTLNEGLNYLYIDRADTGLNSKGFAVSLGIVSYMDIISQTNPDHWWTWNNTYADVTGGNTANEGQSGTQSFSATPISEDTTHSWRSQFGRTGPPNSQSMNDSALTNRTMGGWIRLAGISPKFSCAYEEGGGVNNLAFYTASGNQLVASFADSGDDNVQAFSDVPLEPLRAYHIMFRFSYTDGTNEFILFVDGIRQQVTIGNPLTSTDLDAHGGDIRFGSPGGSLEIGGTNVTFSGMQDALYSNWVTYSRETSVEEINSLFARGAIPTIALNRDTPANMQAQLDGLANTAFGNAPLSLRIPQPVGTSDLDLEADNITFNPLTTLQIEWRGTGNLNWKNLNGSNAEASKLYLTQNGATGNIITPAMLSLIGLEPNTEVRVYEAGTTNELAGIENSATSFSATIEVPSVDIVLMSIDYIYQKLENIDTSVDATVPVQQFFDRNYKNP